MSSLLFNIFKLALLVKLSPVSGWALDLSQFGSCRVLLRLFNTSHRYSDWTTHIIATNPYIPWTITTEDPSPESDTFQLSIHMKRSLCTLNIVMTGGESGEDQFIGYAWKNLNTFRPHMHSTYIAIRWNNISTQELYSNQVAFQYPFRVIYAVISEHEEISFFYFCPVCKSPMRPVHNNNELNTLSNKQFRSDWNPVIVGVYNGPVVSEFSNKECLRYPSSSATCVDVGIIEFMSHILNFTIFYEKNILENQAKHGSITRSSLLLNAYAPNKSLSYYLSVRISYFKYKGLFLFYCIPKNVTNIIQQEGIQTWVSVFENRFWLFFIVSLYLTAFIVSLPLLVNKRKIRAVKFLKTFGSKCFYIISGLLRQYIPSNQRVICIFSFIVALVLYVYENEFTSYVIVEIEPLPYRTSHDVIANNYPVVFHVIKKFYEHPAATEKDVAQDFQIQMLYSGFLKSKNQFEVRVLDIDDTWGLLQEQLRSASFEKIAILDRQQRLHGTSFSYLSIIAEVTHDFNWVDPDVVCFVTKSDIAINPVIWYIDVCFKFEVAKTINIFEQTGIENYWIEQHLYDVLKKPKNIIRKYKHLITPVKKEHSLVSMEQLKPIFMLCLGFMGLAVVIFLIENILGKTHEERLDFFNHLIFHCRNWLFIAYFLMFLGRLFKRIWKWMVPKVRCVDLKHHDYDMYHKIWAQFDPDGSQYIRYDQLTEFLDVLELTLQIQKPNKFKLISMDLPICKGDMMYSGDILGALIREFFGKEPVEEIPTDKPGYEPVSSTLWRQREEYCARIIQNAWRKHRKISGICNYK